MFDRLTQLANVLCPMDVTFSAFMPPSMVQPVNVPGISVASGNSKEPSSDTQFMNSWLPGLLDIFLGANEARFLQFWNVRLLFRETAPSVHSLTFVKLRLLLKVSSPLSVVQSGAMNSVAYFTSGEALFRHPVKETSLYPPSMSVKSMDAGLSVAMATPPFDASTVKFFVPFALVV